MVDASFPVSNKSNSSSSTKTLNVKESMYLNSPRCLSFISNEHSIFYGGTYFTGNISSIQFQALTFNKKNV